MFKAQHALVALPALKKCLEGTFRAWCSDDYGSTRAYRSHRCIRVFSRDGQDPSLPNILSRFKKGIGKDVEHFVHWD